MLRLLKKSALLSASVLMIGVTNVHAASVTFTTLGSYFLPPSGNFSNGAGAGTVYNSGAASLTAPTTPSYASGFNLVSPNVEGEAIFLATAPQGTSPTSYLEITYTDLAGTESGLSGDGTGVGVSTGLPYAIDIGEFGFATNVPAGTAEDFSGLQFVLNYSQTVPTPGGTTTSNSSITGTVTISPNNNPNNSAIDLTIAFSPTTVYIPGTPTVAYTLDPNPVEINLNNASNPEINSAFLSADIALAPLPSTAGTGLSLLAGIGGFAALRRKFVKATVA
jgi:hypothetical protein